MSSICLLSINRRQIYEEILFKILMPKTSLECVIILSFPLANNQNSKSLSMFTRVTLHQILEGGNSVATLVRRVRFKHSRGLTSEKYV